MSAVTTYQSISDQGRASSSGMKGLKIPSSLGSGLIPEFFIRLVLVVIFIILEFQSPFTRTIQKEEIWLYSYPKTDSYVPTSVLWPLVIGVPLVTVLVTGVVSRKLPDTLTGILAITLILPLNGVVTNFIKLSVGRPRPDFLNRCWPDGKIPEDAFLLQSFKQTLVCTGDLDVINDGRKSFPSGHSSFTFAAFGFLFLYSSGKLRTFARNVKGSRSSLRIILPIMILLPPVMVAVSRTCDYHHHWQDVIAGSVLGYLIAWIVYRKSFYYPSLNSGHCDKPYIALSSGHRYTNLDLMEEGNL